MRQYSISLGYWASSDKNQKKISEFLFHSQYGFLLKIIENNWDQVVLELFNLAMNKGRLNYGEGMNRSQGLALNLAP